MVDCFSTGPAPYQQSFLNSSYHKEKSSNLYCKSLQQPTKQSISFLGREEYNKCSRAQFNQSVKQLIVIFCPYLKPLSRPKPYNLKIYLMIQFEPLHVAASKFKVVRMFLQQIWNLFGSIIAKYFTKEIVIKYKRIIGQCK